MLVANLHTQMVLAAASARGVPAEEVLRAVGVESLPTGVTDMVPAKVHEAIYDEAVRRTGDSTLMLYMGELATCDRFDIFAYTLRSLPTLGAAFEMANRLNSGSSPHLRFEIVHDDDTCGWAIEPRESPQVGWRAREIEYLFSMMITALDDITGFQTPVRSVSFRHGSEAAVAAFERRFRAPVRFSQDRNEILIPRAVWAMPSVHHDPALFKALDPHCEELQRTFPDNTDFATLARNSIESALRRGAATELDVAEGLGLSVRTLQHKLHEQGMSYRTLLETVRREMVERLLLEQLPLGKVARQVGYDDARSLHRAFRRWHGCSPNEYRRRRQPTHAEDDE